MKMKIWDSVNQDGETPSKNYITISKKSKVIALSPSVTGLLSLTDKDRVIFLESEDGKWYIAKTDSKAGFAVHKKDASLVVYALQLVNRLSGLLNIEVRTRVEVSENSIEHEGIKIYQAMI